MSPRYASAKLRQAFLDYFVDKGHRVVPSSSLVPADDPTLLFTNAGMVQFKQTFLGRESRDYTRAVSAQCCVRAGGKHNDLDNVGYTARHHTFFEMLGNFSFGDYFKREAIQFCWDFLTNVLKIPEQRLWVSIYVDDEEAADIWLNEIKVEPTRFSRCGKADNFWSMGETGPCGPCTEVFYDHGADIPGGPPGSKDADGDRYVEIWNLVFMQYNCDSDGTLTPLPKPAVDTGMGLERIAAVMQGVHNNYDIDLFQYLIKAITKLDGYTTSCQTSLQVIADHIRSSCFLINDGVSPSNEGRGYVLRRIIRRAIRHGSRLGFNKPFFHKLVKPLVKEMADAYPRLQDNEMMITRTVAAEEDQFAKTLTQGLKIFEQAVAELSGDEIPGDIVFRLFDTYGFPVDLTADIARERNLRVDMPGFERAMAKQRSQSQSASQFAVDYTKNINTDVNSHFIGYDETVSEATVLALYQGNQAVDSLTKDETGMVLLDTTPFYPEAGGQVGDHGQLQHKKTCFDVQDTQQVVNAIGHIGTVTSGKLHVGDKVTAHIDHANRQAIRLNHSATHLLHAALRHLLGDHIQQRGSLVDGQRLRFDFSHPHALSTTQLAEIEQLVNAKIRDNLIVDTQLMDQQAAIDSGAMALFGEKYADKVRVLSMGDFSKELCGGTHVMRTGDIGYFKIIVETGIAAGIRRIEAVTGEAAINWVTNITTTLAQTASVLRATPDTCADKAIQLVNELRESNKHVNQLSQQLSSQQGNALADKAVNIGKATLLVTTITDNPPSDLRHVLDQLKQQLQPAVVVLTVVDDQAIRFIAGVSDQLTEHIKAGDIIKRLANAVGGKGGGRADFAQGGGGDANGLAAALTDLSAWLTKQLESL